MIDGRITLSSTGRRLFSARVMSQLLFAVAQSTAFKTPRVGKSILVEETMPSEEVGSRTNSS